MSLNIYIYQSQYCFFLYITCKTRINLKYSSNHLKLLHIFFECNMHKLLKKGKEQMAPYILTVAIILFIQMLHAEHWGLDRTLLYALANCPGDSAMLLCACDNPLLQYQLLRSPRLGIEGQILQAGTPQGLMSYLFAQ